MIVFRQLFGIIGNTAIGYVEITLGAITEHSTIGIVSNKEEERTMQYIIFRYIVVHITICHI